MKSKIRGIVVQGASFNWNVKSLDSNFICLRIWIDGIKSKPWIQIRYRYDDPWIHFGELVTGGKKAQEVFKMKPIKPKLVAEIIEIAIRDFGRVESHFKTKNLELTETQNLKEIENALSPGRNPFDGPL